MTACLPVILSKYAREPGQRWGVRGCGIVSGIQTSCQLSKIKHKVWPPSIRALIGDCDVSTCFPVSVETMLQVNLAGWCGFVGVFNIGDIIIRILSRLCIHLPYQSLRQPSCSISLLWKNTNRTSSPYCVRVRTIPCVSQGVSLFDHGISFGSCWATVMVNYRLTFGISLQK